MNEPKRHHYVPCMLLKHFTVEGTRTGTLYPFERHGNGKFRWERKDKSPNSVAFVRFFYSIPGTSIGNRPQIVEELLGSKFENKWGQVLQAVVDTSRMPGTYDDLTDLIQFVAFSAIRTPRFKDMVCALFKHIGETAGQLEESKRILEKHNIGGIDHIGEAFGSLVDKSKSGFDQDDRVQAMVIYSPLIFSQFLFRKNWTLYETANSDAFLVCTDDPVTVFDRSGRIYDVSHVFDPERLIMMPLSPKHLLLSERFSDFESLDTVQIATINSMALSHATKGFAVEPRFCHASGDEVTWEEKV